MSSIRVCLVEDDELVRNRLEFLLGKDSGMRVVGAFGSAEAAIEGMDWSGVDVLLADIELPGKSGLEVIRHACQRNRVILAVALTVCDHKPTVFAALKAGAAGYLLKGTPGREIRDAIKKVGSGGAPLSPSIARMVLDDFRQGKDVNSHADQLTTREIEVLRFLNTNLRIKEVADKMKISPQTVQAFLKKIYSKLDVHNRRAAVTAAQRVGVLE